MLLSYLCASFLPKGRPARTDGWMENDLYVILLLHERRRRRRKRNEIFSLFRLDPSSVLRYH